MTYFFFLSSLKHIHFRSRIRFEVAPRTLQKLLLNNIVSQHFTAREGFVAPDPRGGKEETQKETSGAVS